MTPRSRRLVPMPTRPRDQRGRFTKALPPPDPDHGRVTRLSEPTEPILLLPRPLLDFGAVILTAIAIYFLWPFRQLFFLIGVIVIAVRFWLWICRRHPLLGWFIYGFLQGLLGGRRGGETRNPNRITGPADTVARRRRHLLHHPPLR